MSDDAQKVMAEVLEMHRGRERGMVCDEDELWCDGCKCIVKADEIAAHQAAEIDKALGGLKEVRRVDLNDLSSLKYQTRFVGGWQAVES